jgi:ABC-2 type transport system permease protein
MRKTFLVMRQELSTTFRRPSYLIFAFGVPILAVLILGGIKLLQSRSNQNTGSNSSTPTETKPDVEGFVDHSGLIQTIPDDVQGYLTAYDDETLAKQALKSGEITAYYVIPLDYIQRGEVKYVYPNDSSYLADGQAWVIKKTMNLNLLGGNQELADRIWNPIWEFEVRQITPEFNGSPTSGEDCSRPGIACESNELIRMMPSMLVVVFFIAFMSSSNMLFNSIGAEKENRTIELLMLSINSRQLLAGKTVALGISGIAQTIVWLTAITILFNMGGATLSLPEGFRFPIDIMAWSLFFFIGGFALYASLMAGAGALVPKMKEAGIANFVAMFPLFFGYVFGIIAPLAEATGSILVMFLSVFPLTSPVVMVMRLTDGHVPPWQLLLALGLLFITAYFALRMVAAMFHAQTLLSGQPFSVKRYLKALAGKT